MELKNKKVFFLGDSITEGVGASCPECGFVSVFGQISGAEVKNYGAAGTRIARQTNCTTPEWDSNDFMTRVDNMEENADAVFVLGGTNDYGHGDAEIGSFDSRSEYTFYGAMHILCNKLISKYPSAEIVFATPLHRCDEDGNSKNASLKQYADIIKEVAEFYGFPVLDLFGTSGIQPKVDIIKEKYMPDGLHPSDAGAKKIANRICGFLKSL